MQSLQVPKTWDELITVAEFFTRPNENLFGTVFAAFADQTGDFFPHHMDAERCKTQPFKQHIAHGTLTFSVAIGMTATEINPEAFSKGYDRLLFVKPVHIGNTIHVKISVSKKADPNKPRLDKVVQHLEVFNQRDELVLVCDHILLAKKKDV